MKKSIPEFLKTARTKSGRTQKEVESLLNLRALTIRDYETGRLKLPVEMAIQLAKLYQISLDELIGFQLAAFETDPKKEKAYYPFKSLFTENAFTVMYLDPIIRAFLEDQPISTFENPLFHLITREMSESKQRLLIRDIIKMLASLASSDKKITNEEISCLKEILLFFKEKKSIKELESLYSSIYYPEEIPSYMEKVECRHFIVWLLFFFATVDNQLAHEEITYIEEISIKLKINRSNYLFIKNKFTGEQ